MTELGEPAKALDINLPADNVTKNFQVMEKLPYEATSPMQAYFASNRPTEQGDSIGCVCKLVSPAARTTTKYFSIMNERRSE